MPPPSARGAGQAPCSAPGFSSGRCRGQTPLPPDRASLGAQKAESGLGASSGFFWPVEESHHTNPERSLGAWHVSTDAVAGQLVLGGKVRLDRLFHAEARPELGDESPG